MQLVRDMFNYFECHFTWKLHSVFVNSSHSCSSLRIGATVTSITDSLACQIFSRFESWLTHWKSTNAMVERVNIQHSLKHSEVKTQYCKAQSLSSIAKFNNCHRVISCYTKSNVKDKTVCQLRNMSYKKIHEVTKQSTRKNSTKNLRFYCNVDDSN